MSFCLWPLTIAVRTPVRYPAALMKFQHSCGSKSSQMSPRASNKASKVLAPIRRKWALSFENAISIELRSGLYGGQEQEPTALPSHCFGGAGAFVRGPIVENDNGAGFKFGGELGFNISFECRAVHSTGDDPRRDQRVLRQPCDECLCPPFAEGCGSVKRSPTGARATQASEVRLHRKRCADPTYLG